MAGVRNYLIVTASYWSFTLIDGALRMLVLLHLYRLGYTPFMLASLFLLYETAGIFANLAAAVLRRASASRACSRSASIAADRWLVCCRRSTRLGRWLFRRLGRHRAGISGVAKDVTKTASKSAIKATSEGGADNCSAGSRGLPARRMR